jgi:hypothetical protein
MPEEISTVEKSTTGEDLSDKRVYAEDAGDTKEIWSARDKTAGPEESQGELTDKEIDAEIDAIEPGKASPFDPDFILVFLLAIFIDLFVDPIIAVLDAFFGGAATMVAAPIIDVFGVLSIGPWIYWKSKQVVLPQRLATRLKGMEKGIMAKVQAKINKKIASKAVRRVLPRMGGALLVESIPGADVFTSWTVAVLSML